jgi:L-malate glycosyltransferase
MKVLHFSTAESWRGGEQQIAYLIEELQIIGVSQLVLCPIDSALSRYCEDKSISYSTFKKKNPLALALKFRQICKKEKIDIAHLHDSGAHTLAIFSADVFHNPIPLILSRRVDFPMKKNLLSKHKYNHKKIKKIVCVSEAIRQMYLADIKDKSKLLTVHSGIDVNRFAGRVEGHSILRNEFSIAPDVLLIGNVAAIAPHKDYFTFADTVSLLNQKGLKAHYFAIGNQEDTEETAKVKNYIEAQNLSTSITLIGHRADIHKILPELDIFLMTSKTEGLGTSILDAFASKVPVVATDAGGISEAVIHEKTGLLTSVQNPQQLTEQVIRLVNDTQLRAQLIQNASIHLQHFTKQNTAQNTYKIYKEVLEKE